MTITRKKHLSVVLSAIAFIVGIKFAINYLGPFVASFVLAYLPQKMINKLEKYGLNRNIMSALWTFSIFVICIIIIHHTFGFLIHKISDIVSYTSHAISSADFTKIEEKLANFVPAEGITESLRDYTKSMSSYTLTLLNMAQTRVASAVGNLLNLMLIPIITYNLTIKWDSVISSIVKLTPKVSQPAISKTLQDISDNLSKYLKGQFIVVLILSIMYSFALYLAGLNYFLLMGVLMGLSSFVPFIGSLSVFVLTALVSFGQFGDVQGVATTLLYLFAVQILDSSIITPKIIGDSIGVDVNWIIFGLLVSAGLFGLAGVLFSMPIIAIATAIIANVHTYYKKSKLYTK